MKRLECVMVQDPHLLQILLEHLEHGLQFSHLPLKSYVTLTVKENTHNSWLCSPSSLIWAAFHIRRYSCIYRELPGCGPRQRNGLQLYVGLLGAGGTTAPVVGLSKDKAALDCEKRKEMEETTDQLRLVLNSRWCYGWVSEWSCAT